VRKQVALGIGSLALADFHRWLRWKSPGDSGSVVTTEPPTSAGPLENLIRNHPEETVDAVDVQARRDGRFRSALNSVYFLDRVPPAVVQRLARFRQ
jgi:hypothetical protein